MQNTKNGVLARSRVFFVVVFVFAWFCLVLGDVFRHDINLRLPARKRTTFTLMQVY